MFPDPREGSRTVWIEDTPYPGTNIPECLSAHANDIQRCSVSRDVASLSPYQDGEGRSIARQPVQEHLSLTLSHGFAPPKSVRL